MKKYLLITIVLATLFIPYPVQAEVTHRISGTVDKTNMNGTEVPIVECRLQDTSTPERIQVIESVSLEPDWRQEQWAVEFEDQEDVWDRYYCAVKESGGTISSDTGWVYF